MARISPWPPIPDRDALRAGQPAPERGPVRKRLGLDLRFHDLRHTCITLLLDLGAPVHVVQQITGHSDHGVTMKVYAHASLDEQRKALGRLEDRLA